jgi:pimeloyl-ACP methyl ester carboxylesterase
MSARSVHELSPAQVVLAAADGYDRVDAVGFSAGGQAVLAAAAAAPSRFRRVAVLGVGNPADPADQADQADPADQAGPADRAGPEAAATDVVAAGLESDEEPADQVARVVRRLAETVGNDRFAVAAYLRSSQAAAVTPADVARIEAPTLVVLGDRDFAGPADALVAALPYGEFAGLRGVDHFATPTDYGCIDAVLRFLAE